MGEPGVRQLRLRSRARRCANGWETSTTSTADFADGPREDRRSPRGAQDQLEHRGQRVLARAITTSTSTRTRCPTTRAAAENPQPPPRRTSKSAAISAAIRRTPISTTTRRRPRPWCTGTRARCSRRFRRSTSTRCRPGINPSRFRNGRFDIVHLFPELRVRAAGQHAFLHVVLADRPRAHREPQHALRLRQRQRRPTASRRRYSVVRGREVLREDLATMEAALRGDVRPARCRTSCCRSRRC